MNFEVIKTVQELTNKYGSTIYTDSRKLKSFLSDYYSDKYTREKRLLVDSVEQKIPYDIVNCNGTQIDDFLYNKLASKLFDNLGISKDLAEETIDAWCEILNKTHTKVNNQSSSNLNNNNYGQTRPGNAANCSQQNYSSNTVIMSAPSISNNNNYGQIRPGSAVNHSQQSYNSNTVFMNNQQVNNMPVINNKRKKSIKIIIGMMLIILIIVIVSTLAYSLGSNKVTTDKNLTNAGVESKETNSNQNNADTKNNTTNNTKEKKTQTKSNNFIFPDSSTSKISPSNLYNLSNDQLFIARNEIFARHGYIFNDKKLQNYFESQAWYKPNPSAKGEPSNEIENDNAQTIMDMEEIKLAFKNSPRVSREYVLNNSQITKLTSDEVERLSDFELLIARNEIFARHGYIFGVPELNDYFQSKRWYNKISNDVTLGEVEEYNIELIRKAEDKRIYNMLSNYELGTS